MGKRTIIFYAPVGTNLPVHLLGGGEKGCRRTREILSNAGYNVITIDRLIYFGRVSESKNVDVVIKVAYELEKAGYKTSTTVIGGYG